MGSSYWLDASYPWHFVFLTELSQNMLDARMATPVKESLDGMNFPFSRWALGMDGRGHPSSINVCPVSIHAQHLGGWPQVTKNRVPPCSHIQKFIYHDYTTARYTNNSPFISSICMDFVVPFNVDSSALNFCNYCSYNDKDGQFSFFRGYNTRDSYPTIYIKRYSAIYPKV